MVFAKCMAENKNLQKKVNTDDFALVSVVWCTFLNPKTSCMGKALNLIKYFGIYQTYAFTKLYFIVLFCTLFTVLYFIITVLYISTTNLLSHCHKVLDTHVNIYFTSFFKSPIVD